MIGYKSSFANQVRVAARRLQEEKGSFTSAQLKNLVDWKGRSKRAVQNVILDLRRSGQIANVEHGVYRFVEIQPGPIQKREIMWRFLRMQRNVSVDDMVVAADVSAQYAEEFLRNLVTLGIARQTKDRFQLVKDQLEVPDNDAKAQKLRDIRAKKKARLALGLKRATIVISEAIRFLEDECE